MSVRLTKRVVDSVEPAEKDQFLWDGVVKGFGLKVTPNGGRVYVLQYRFAAKLRRYTIGKHGSPWTPDMARQEAERLLRLIAEGTDPQSAKIDARHAPEADLFADVAELFIERYAKPNNKAWGETARLLNRDVAPVWGKRPIKEIRRRDVIDLLDAIVDSGRPVHANRTLAAIRKLFNWCVERDMLESSPCQGVKAPTAEVARDRVLSDAEIVHIWRAALSMGYPFGDFIRLLMLTGQRRDEVAEMRWAEVDLEAGLWTIPKERAKNGQAHQVHLSACAVTIVEKAPRILDPKAPKRTPSPFVFTTTGYSPISGFSGAKETLDGLVLSALRQQSGEDVSAPENWRFHDIRRTVATQLAGMNVPPHVVDRLINHRSGAIKGVTAVYIRHDYAQERREALEMWEARLAQLTAAACH